MKYICKKQFRAKIDGKNYMYVPKNSVWEAKKENGMYKLEREINDKNCWIEINEAGLKMWFERYE